MYHKDVKFWNMEILDTHIDIELLDDTMDQKLEREELDELYFQCRNMIIKRIEEVKPQINLILLMKQRKSLL